jgi:hypothetical protein
VGSASSFVVCGSEKQKKIAKIVVFKQSENEGFIEIQNEQRDKEQKRKGWIELKWKKGRC